LGVRRQLSIISQYLGTNTHNRQKPWGRTSISVPFSANVGGTVSLPGIDATGEDEDDDDEDEVDDIDVSTTWTSCTVDCGSAGETRGRVDYGCCSCQHH